jgi:peptidoglycan hydrolase-like protein with peptidoglycan-binding domain
MVEYCTKDADGNINIHVIEGNTPVSVKRTVYSLTYTRILGYGTVHDVADVTMRYGNSGEKVTQLQKKLVYLGYLNENKVNGTFGTATVDAVKAFQHDEGLNEHGVANKTMQDALNKRYDAAVDSDPATWQVVDDD